MEAAWRLLLSIIFMIQAAQRMFISCWSRCEGIAWYTVTRQRRDYPNMFFFQVKKMKNFASGSATQVVDSNISYGKSCQDVDKVQMIFFFI